MDARPPLALYSVFALSSETGAAHTLIGQFAMLSTFISCLLQYLPNLTKSWMQDPR